MFSATFAISAIVIFLVYAYRGFEVALLFALAWLSAVVATRHAANYAATDKMQQVGQQPSNKMIRWLRICRLPMPRNHPAHYHRR
jgi:hypothetical protein